MYALDNDDRLPGPCWTGMFYTYQEKRTTDPAQRYDGSLAAYIATYLGYPPPKLNESQDAKVAQCPASMRKLPALVPRPPLRVPISYFSLSTITNDAVGRDRLTYPFGRPNSPYAETKKQSMIRRPSDTWAMTDCDKQLMTRLGITSATYINYIAELPVHSDPTPARRQYLYYDWSVRSRETPK
jgi:hypothetical protein